MYEIKDFKLQAFLDVAEELLRSDETLRALDFLDNFLPGYYRDNIPPEIHALKREIMGKIATSSFYATHKGFELTVDDDSCEGIIRTLRGILIMTDIQLMNKEGLIPHVYDHGPGEASLPYALKGKGCKFTYEQAYVNQPTFEATQHRFKDLVKERSPEQPIIWVATEIVEHLHKEEEIRYEMENRCGLADVIHISTPLYAFAPNVMNWRDIGWLGHLRTYTPSDFQSLIKRLYPEYVYMYYQSQVQHGRLINPKSRFECIKTNIQIKSPDEETGPGA